MSSNYLYNLADNIRASHETRAIIFTRVFLGIEDDVQDEKFGGRKKSHTPKAPFFHLRRLPD